MQSRRRTAALPLALTPILGREGELAETALLIGQSRLLTITGAGGSGKTRLALELAHRSAGSAETAWVDLGTITDAELVGERILAAAGSDEPVADDVLHAILSSIGERSLLLILDNCEHLIERVSFFAEQILRFCAETRILATSRESLGIHGEQSWGIPPLTPAAAAGLFLERARSVSPSFRSDDATDDLITHICARLDGIPLAIELAAARVRTLSVGEIAERLDDAFRLLSAGARNLPRHRTIHEAIDWSYRLLTPSEQQMLQRLSIFPGTFSLDAAENICGDGDLDPLTQLGTLVDKSLVLVEGGSPAGYRLLDTVRQFAAAHWNDENDRGALHQRQREYCLRLVEEAAPGLTGGVHDEALIDRLDRETVTIRTLLDDPTRSRAETEVRLAMALVWYWWARSAFHEARRRLDKALTDASGLDETSKARVASAVALVALWQGEWERAIPLAAEAVAPLRTGGSDADIATNWTILASALAFTGDEEAAKNGFDQALAAARQAGNRALEIFALYGQGVSASQLPDARTALESAARLAEGSALLPARARIHSALAEIALREGNMTEAVSLLREVFSGEAAVLDRWTVVAAIEAAGLTLLEAREVENGMRLLAGASAAWLRLGARPARVEKVERDKNEQIQQALREDRLRTVIASGAAMSDDALFALAEEELSRLGLDAVPALRIRALGSVVIERDGTLIDESARSKELLLYLLCHPAGRSKTQIAAALWPDAEPTKFRNNFHVTLHRLRKALGAAEWILVDGDTYVVDRRKRLDFDVERFEREMQAALRAKSRTRIEQALELYRGDFYEDSSKGEWHLTLQSRLSDLRRKGLEALANAHAATGDHPAAAAVWERMIELDSLDELAARRMIESLVLAGETERARRVWTTLARALRQELGVEPSFPAPL
jgi:predicted ATPase/DNA-binding SARP family transcriptional activator